MYIFLCVPVTGPEFQHIKVGVGHRLDASSSGVLGMIIFRAERRVSDHVIIYEVSFYYPFFFLKKTKN